MKKGNKESKEINYKKEGNKLWAGIESEETDKRIYEFIERLYLQEKPGPFTSALIHLKFLLFASNVPR